MVLPAEILKVIIMIEELGVMINCSQGAIKTVNGLKRLIDVVKKMGYTYIMLYTEDTYEIKAGGILKKNLKR